MAVYVEAVLYENGVLKLSATAATWKDSKRMHVIAVSSLNSSLLKAYGSQVASRAQPRKPSISPSTPTCSPRGLKTLDQVPGGTCFCGLKHPHSIIFRPHPNFGPVCQSPSWNGLSDRTLRAIRQPTFWASWLMASHR